MQFPGEDLYSSCVIRQTSLCLTTWPTWRFVCLERDEEEARKITDQRCRTSKQRGIIKIWMVHYDDIVMFCKNVRCIRYISMFCACVNHLHTPCYTLCLYLAFHLCACFCASVHAHCCLHEASPCILGGSTVFRRNKTQSILVGQMLSSHCSKKKLFIPHAVCVFF